MREHGRRPGWIQSFRSAPVFPGDWVAPYSKGKMCFFTCSANVYGASTIFPVYMILQHHSKPRARECASRELPVRTERARVPGDLAPTRGRAPQSQRPACARPREARPHLHAHAREGQAPASPALRRRRARAGAQSTDREGGSSKQGGCPRAPLVHMRVYVRSPASAPPTSSPARGLRAPQAARVRARAQVRALRGRPRRLQ